MVKKERESLGQARYLPTIQWYYWLAAYLEAEKSEKETALQLKSSINEMRKNQHKEKKINQLIEEVKPHIPDVIRFLNTI